MAAWVDLDLLLESCCLWHFLLSVWATVSCHDVTAAGSTVAASLAVGAIEMHTADSVHACSA